MKIHIAITTYNRPEHYKLLIKSIMKNIGGHEVTIHTYDDGSEMNLTHPKEVRSFKYPVNNGKQGYWRVIDRALGDAAQYYFDYFFLLQDDCELIKDFFDVAIKQWENINDPEKATYCTFTPTNVYNRIMWSSGRARDVVHNGVPYIKGNYVDCIFMCPRSTLERLDFRMNPIDPKVWVGRPNYSSGVGQQLSARLRELGMTMYTAWSSLTINNEQESMMNPEERKKNPLSSWHRSYAPDKLAESSSERKIVGIASIPSRQDALKRTLISLVGQVDEIHVVLNGYHELPSFKFPNVTYYLDPGTAGDANKFKFVQDFQGYYFSCDDDITYPPDYVDTMIKKINEYGRNCYITCHGRVVPDNKIKHFYNDTKQYHFMLRQQVDIPVHIPGTGVGAFHTDTLMVKFEDFKEPNMADIWVGLLCQEQNVGCISIKRTQGWLRGQTIPQDTPIFERAKNHDTIQVGLVNNHNWI